MCKRLFKALKMKMDNFKLRYELAGAEEEIVRLREHKVITDNLVEQYAQKCKKLEEENILLKSEKRISDAQLKCLENAEKQLIRFEQYKINFAVKELEKAQRELNSRKLTHYTESGSPIHSVASDRIKELIEEQINHLKKGSKNE